MFALQNAFVKAEQLCKLLIKLRKLRKHFIASVKTHKFDNITEKAPQKIKFETKLSQKLSLTCSIVIRKVSVASQQTKPVT